MICRHSLSLKTANISLRGYGRCLSTLRSSRRPTLDHTSLLRGRLTLIQGRNFEISRQLRNLSSSSLKWTIQKTEKDSIKNKIVSKEDILHLPNFLTFTRLLTAPVIGYLVVNHQTSWALALFGYSCFTDLLDGYIARRFKSQTVVRPPLLIQWLIKH